MGSLRGPATVKAANDRQDRTTAFAASADLSLTLTMAMSIIHRITGVALYFGTLLLVWWLIAAASGPAAYANVQAFTSSFIGRLIVFGYTWALMHHLLSGLRHFVWDLGYGFKANEREALTWGALIGGISLTVLLWIAAYVIGGGR